MTLICAQTCNKIFQIKELWYKKWRQQTQIKKVEWKIQNSSTSWIIKIHVYVEQVSLKITGGRKTPYYQDCKKAIWRIEQEGERSDQARISDPRGNSGKRRLQEQKSSLRCECLEKHNDHSNLRSYIGNKLLSWLGGWWN